MAEKHGDIKLGTEWIEGARVVREGGWFQWYGYRYQHERLLPLVGTHVWIHDSTYGGPEVRETGQYRDHSPRTHKPIWTWEKYGKRVLEWNDWGKSDPIFVAPLGR